MIYIAKDFTDTAIIDYENELKINQLDKNSLADPNIHPTMKGKDVYDQVRSFNNFKRLKDKMFQDQGGICCYCGQILKFLDHPPYIVEHVHPKESCRELAGEYENLLLSCRPTNEEEESRMKAGRKCNNFWHCDKSKESKILTYTPLQSDCNSHFIYYESGDIEGCDEPAKEDIKTLGLNCDYLIKRRKEAIFAVLYDENGQLLPNDILEKYLSIVMQRKADNTLREFCFVIAGALNNFLYNKVSL